MHQFHMHLIIKQQFFNYKNITDIVKWALGFVLTYCLAFEWQSAYK